MSDNLDDTTRICSDCRQEYPLNREHFRYQKDKSGKYYYQRRCIFCQRKVDNANEQKKGTSAQRTRKYRQSHPEKVKAGKRDWEARNPEKVKAQKQSSHIRCKDKNNRCSRDWHYANIDHVKQQRSEHYLEHRDEIIARVVQYQRDNPDQFHAVQHRRRAREMGSEGTFTADDIQTIYTEQEGRCAYCGMTLHGDFQIDHVHALARGGTNWPDNLALACSSCNASKSDKTPDEWALVRGW